MRHQNEPPFGPDSLIWQNFGSRLGYLIGPAYGLLQVMHPAIGAGVDQHSQVYDEPWQRLIRSLPQISATIFGGDGAHDMAARIRKYHNNIEGVDNLGRAYHALDPDTYFWAHATFVHVMYFGTELLGAPLSEPEKFALYEEAKHWYAMYGLSMRPVPKDYPAFMAYWDDMCANVLEATPGARRLLELMRDPAKHDVPLLPKPVARVLYPIGAPVMRWNVTGILPPAARRTLGLRWTERDERRFRGGWKAVGTVWNRLPERVKLMPDVYAAHRRAANELEHGALDRAEVAVR